jgi:hypothetical protein
MDQTTSNIDEKLKAIEKLLGLFKFERICYLVITIISIIVLFTCAIYLITSGGKNQIPSVIGLFSSTGGIMYVCGRLLRMWSDAINFVESKISKN